MSRDATAAGKAPPRYLQVADTLRSAILSGELSPTEYFPTESELCKTHGVSRFTVREALRRLESEGLIARRRGSGTVVRPAAARGGTLHQPLSNVGEILQYAQDTSITLSAEGEAKLPRKIADEVGTPANEIWHHFRGVRLRDGDERPIAVTDAFVHGRLADVARAIDLTQTTLFRQIEQLGNINIGRITQDIQAVSASAEMSALLRVQRRSPCLRILRCYYDIADDLFEISASYHPGERFAYSMHIENDR
ncbi:GntR family transcriptional regulator [Sphingomonas radiodurans]|uniref:GntR family transcriptional regulator n=1 Tax=Sphingomonas radiodurans TaxID=2890321 RepID=UPI001E3A8E69|nr:GntR family transcriptional regulator [Sphingomonas radiodurans]WBH18029.1 GntR family transcriptional regulator [Sphingomonas radiodurans]